MQKFEGLIAAPFAPMYQDGSLNYDSVDEYSDFLVRNHIVGAFINGSTGEGVSLTLKEKQLLTEKWVNAAKGTPMKVINLVTGTSYIECIEQAQQSQEAGADAIAILAPYYFKPSSGSQLAEYCAKIAESVPTLPVYFYHIPVLTGCNVSMFDFLRAAGSMIPNLAGIKYTHEDFMDFLTCMNFDNGKYDMLWGRDENLLSALVLGCRSGVGSTYNYAAPLYYGIIEAFDKGELDIARKLQQQSIDMIRLLGKYGGIATGKAYMKYLGFDFGGFRSPIQNMSLEVYQHFRADVQALNMENWFSKR